MQDRFKFRGQTDLGIWIYGFLYTSDGKIAILMDNEIGYTVKPETIGQCTGLKDSTGKLIFEGDILQVTIKDFESLEFKVRKTYWSVEYKQFSNSIGFMAYGINRRWHALLTHNMLFSKDAIVVGNIHENAELLEKE